MSKSISSWNQEFPLLPCSPISFLTSIRDAIERHHLRFVRIEGTFHGRGRSGKRIYLRVSHRRYYIDIGAAPYGDGLFVSVWLFEKTFWRDAQEGFASLFLSLGKQIRKSSGRLGEWGPKQMYQTLSPYPEDVYHQDEVSMFQHLIKKVIQETIQDLTDSQGERW